MKRPALFFISTLVVLLSIFAFYSFRNQQGTDSGYALVVVSNTDISLSYGNGKYENLILKPGRYADNDNTTVGVFNKLGMQGYTLVSSTTSRDGSMYFVFNK